MVNACGWVGTVGGLTLGHSVSRRPPTATSLLSFVRWFVVRLFVRSLVGLLSFVRSFVCLFVRSFVCSFVRSFVRWFVCLFVGWFVGWFVRRVVGQCNCCAVLQFVVVGVGHILVRGVVVVGCRAIVRVVFVSSSSFPPPPPSSLVGRYFAVAACCARA